MFRLSRTDRNHITIDVSARKLTLFQGDTVLGTYPIAIGKSSTPTPLGQWQVFPQVSIGTPVLITNGTSAAAKGHGKTYTVRPGDTLWQIAHTHQISLDALMAANPTVSPHNLFAGQTVLLP